MLDRTLRSAKGSGGKPEPIAIEITEDGVIVAAPGAAGKGGDLALTYARNEQRVDSRALAAHLGNKHKNVIELVERYKAQFRGFGVVPFETEKPTGASGGRPERYALLNEDQAIFLLTLTRNSARVVALKVKLVAAFQAARKAAEMRQTEYLPLYHELHDTLHALAAGAEHERYVHMNLNRLINRAAGVEPGMRARAGVARQGMLIAAQAIAAEALRGAGDHREGYERVKAALAPLHLVRIGGRT